MLNVYRQDIHEWQIMNLNPQTTSRKVLTYFNNIALHYIKLNLITDDIIVFTV